MCGLPPSFGLRQRVPWGSSELLSPLFSTLDPMIVDCQQFPNEILSQQIPGKNTRFIYRQLLTIGDLNGCIAIDADEIPITTRMEQHQSLPPSQQSNVS